MPSHAEQAALSNGIICVLQYTMDSLMSETRCLYGQELRCCRQTVLIEMTPSSHCRMQLNISAGTTPKVTVSLATRHFVSFDAFFLMQRVDIWVTR